MLLDDLARVDGRRRGFWGVDMPDRALRWAKRENIFGGVISWVYKVYGCALELKE